MCDLISFVLILVSVHVTNLIHYFVCMLETNLICCNIYFILNVVACIVFCCRSCNYYESISCAS